MACFLLPPRVEPRRVQYYPPARRRATHEGEDPREGRRAFILPFGKGVDDSVSGGARMKVKTHLRAGGAKVGGTVDDGLD
jgi:hypothetical protein